MSIDNEKQIFALIFRVANQLQTTIDQSLKDDDLTTKQFLMMIVIDFFDYHPSLNEIAELFGTSRQNAKQVVNKLVKHGYVKMEKDNKDKRTLRFNLTSKAQKYWNERDSGDSVRMEKLFQNMDPDYVEILLKGLQQMLVNLEEMKNENSCDI